MAPRGISHVAIGVREMDRSLAFYTGVVGMTVRFDELEQFGSGGDFPGATRRGVYLQLADDPDAPFIVLDQQLGREPWGQPAEFFQVGVHHFGFWVDDVDAVAERARATGTPIFAGPADADSKDYGEPPGSPMRTVLLRDPDGNVVQFDQRVV